MRKVSSQLIADKVGTTNRTIIKELCDMLTAGTVGKEVFPPSRSGEIKFDKTARLSLADFIALAVHMTLPRSVTDPIALTFTRAESTRPPLVNKHVDRGAAQDVLGRPELVDAVKALRDGAADPSETAGKYGVRLVNDMVWIGTSTPFITKACEAAGLVQGQLGAELGAIQGALRHGTKKFKGRDSKVISIPLDAFLELVEGSDEAQ